MDHGTYKMAEAVGCAGLIQRVIGWVYGISIHESKVTS